MKSLKFWAPNQKKQRENKIEGVELLEELKSKGMVFNYEIREYYSFVDGDELKDQRMHTLCIDIKDFDLETIISKLGTDEKIIFYTKKNEDKTIFVKYGIYERCVEIKSDKGSVDKWLKEKFKNKYRIEEKKFDDGHVEYFPQMSVCSLIDNVMELFYHLEYDKSSCKTFQEAIDIINEDKKFRNPPVLIETKIHEVD